MNRELPLVIDDEEDHLVNYVTRRRSLSQLCYNISTRNWSVSNTEPELKSR